MRTRNQVLVLAALLVAWELGLAVVRGERWLAGFATGPDLVDLAAAKGGLPLPGGGRRLPPAPGDARSLLRLATAPLDPARDHLITLRVAPGPEFALQLFDRSQNRPVGTWSIPARARPLERRLFVGRDDLPESHRFQVWLGRPEPLEISGLEIRALDPAWRAVRAAVTWLGPLLLLAFAWRHREALARYLRGAPPGPPRPPERVWDALTAGLLLLAAAHLYLAAPVQQLLDARFSTAVSYRLLTRGTLSLPDEMTQVDPERLPYQLQEVDGRLFHVYPDAVAVLNVPIVAGYALAGVTPLAEGSFFRRHDELRILLFAAATQAAALCAVLFLLARLYLRPAPALALTALFAAGTQIASSISRAYWSHAWAVLLLAAALYLLLRDDLRGRRWSTVAAATLLSWAFFCRPPMSLSIVAIVALSWWAASRSGGRSGARSSASSGGATVATLAVTGAVWGGLFVLYSLWNFGTPIPRYFLAQHLETGILGLETMRRSYPRALAGTLVSPSRGLFVFVPIFAVILAAVAARWRRLPDRGLAVAALASIGATWQLLASNRSWFGGQCFGPRLFSDVVPWFFLLAVLVLASGGAGRGRAWRRRGVVALIALAAAASIFINVRGAVARETITWSGHSYWDWRHPQFLAGLFEEPEPATFEERLAAARGEREPAARQRLLEEVLASPEIERRAVGAGTMVAAGVTFDRWTYGTRPAALVVTNDGAEPLAPAIRLAVWAGEGSYPIRVSVDDGGSTRELRWDGPGIERVELDPVAPRSSRLYIVWCDTAWSPGGDDRRRLGVQLLPPTG